jgi:FlaA1/EpsC-like NDP-sugar epimerase
MANALIRARGLRPGKDIELVVTGVRDGERLSENLLGPQEYWRETPNPSIRQVLTPMPAAIDDLQWTLEQLTELAREQKSTELTRALRRATWTPAPIEEPNLVHTSSESGRIEAGDSLQYDASER